MIALQALAPYLEPAAAITLVLNVYLAARAQVSNFLFGAIGVALYFLIFYQAKLYADMGLQVVYFSLQFYGGYQWLYGSSGHTALPIRKINKKTASIAIFSTGILFLLLSYLLGHYTDSTTVKIDAWTTAMSLTAQWMMNKKYLENWWVWMLVNSISIKMYFSKSLYMTSGLYMLFLILCVMGYLNWQKQCKEEREEAVFTQMDVL